jgi:hypothetical protein
MWLFGAKAFSQWWAKSTILFLKCGARCRHYVQEGTFLLDVATLLPLDILYIWLGTGTPTNRHSF